jgi:hypothetical protein
MKRKAVADGRCWCGCGTSVPTKKFFAPHHDRKAETMLMKLHYGSIANMVASHGHDSDKSSLRNESERSD